MPHTLFFPRDNYFFIYRLRIMTDVNELVYAMLPQHIIKPCATLPVLH